METLADLLLRETWRKKSTIGSISGIKPEAIRRDLTEARRFVLDDKMAGFIADLSMAPFAGSPIRRPEVLDALRHGARLPHKKTWVEFSGQAFRRRMLEAYPTAHDASYKHLAPVDEVPPRWGWLMHESESGRGVSFLHCIDMTPIPPLICPFRFMWNVMDGPVMEFRDDMMGDGARTKVSFEDGMLAHGISGYFSHAYAVWHNTAPDKLPESMQQRVISGKREWVTHRLLAEVGGMMRYAMAFLATLNDVPVVAHEVKQSKGFVARGSYRKYLDHTIIHLHIPERKEVKSLARKYVGAARRRCHQVRGHWRMYHRGDPELLCQPSDHHWGAPTITVDIEGKEHQHASCISCTARRTWIDEHLRGDDKLGFVVHDYSVTHD